jgi:hypothetical protein
MRGEGIGLEDGWRRDEETKRGTEEGREGGRTRTISTQVNPDEKLSNHLTVHAIDDSTVTGKQRVKVLHRHTQAVSVSRGSPIIHRHTQAISAYPITNDYTRPT